jgi:hypothetical protein
VHAAATSTGLLSPRFLFRFSVPCRSAAPLPTIDSRLAAKYALPSLEPLDGRAALAEVRMAWSPQGLAFWMQVRKRRRAPRCDENRLADSDGIQVWIGTRESSGIHRATRFCHRFAFLPTGGGRKNDQPVADQLLIPRARENAPPVGPRQLRVASEVRRDGYLLSAQIPAEALAGYQPRDHAQLAFTYLVVDSELGEQAFCCSATMPFHEDPSLWARLELVD